MNESSKFDWIALALLSLCAPVFLFPKGNLALAAVVVPVLWIIRRFVTGRAIPRTLPDIPIAIILLAVLFSTIVNRTSLHSFPKVLGFLFAVAMYYAVVAVLRTEKQVKRAIYLFLAAGFGFALFASMGMYTFKVKHFDFLAKLKESLPSLGFKLAGAEAGFAPNAVGGILLLFLPVLAFLAYCFVFRADGAAGRRAHTRWLMAGGLVLVLMISFVVLLLTQSRGAWLALMLSAGVVFFAAIRKKKILLVSALLVVIVSGVVMGPELMKINRVQLTTKQAQGTMVFRLQMWDRALPEIIENPVLGIGLNRFRYLPEIKYEESHAHNKLIHLAVELGIFASAAYLALLILSGYMVVRVWKQQNVPGWFKYAILGLGTGQLAHAIFELTDVIPLGAKVGVIPWISLALIAAIFKKFSPRTNTDDTDK